jgi:hypothetical protein
MVYDDNAKLLQQPKFTIQLLFGIFTIVVICFGEIKWLVIKINILGLMMQQIG